VVQEKKGLGFWVLGQSFIPNPKAWKHAHVFIAFSELGQIFKA
jgi:hypothetical protein